MDMTAIGQLQNDVAMAVTLIDAQKGAALSSHTLLVFLAM